MSCVRASTEHGPHLRWFPAVRAAGLDGVRLHDLRRCCGLLMIASGADVKHIQQVIGHSSATLTLDTYGHLMPDRLDDLMTRMDNLVDGAKPMATAPVQNLSRAARGMEAS